MGDYEQSTNREITKSLNELAGYAYLYISNEHPYLMDVYFDDVTVNLTPSPVVQMEDFYPFGLAFNSYSRENSVAQNYLYNGKEQIKNPFDAKVFRDFNKFANNSNEIRNRLRSIMKGIMSSGDNQRQVERAIEDVLNKNIRPGKDGSVELVHLPRTTFSIGTKRQRR